MEGKYDILIATTIIENGLDVPNANTIFINNAQNFAYDLHKCEEELDAAKKHSVFITPALVYPERCTKRIQAWAICELNRG